MNDLKTQHDRGYRDGYCNQPAIYGCHLGMRQELSSWRDAYYQGHEQGHWDSLRDIHDDHKFDAMNDTGDE